MYALTRIRTEWVALALGLALATALVLSWRISGETAIPAAHVEIVTAPSSDFAVTPDGRTSGEGSVRPSAPEGGFEREVTVRNATAGPLALSVRLPAAQSELDGALKARVAVDDTLVYDGVVRGLSQGSSPYPMTSGQTAKVSILVWIPESPDGDWEARSSTLPLELVSAEEGS
jgi:hypothetical protein